MIILYFFLQEYVGVFDFSLFFKTTGTKYLLTDNISHVLVSFFKARLYIVLMSLTKLHHLRLTSSLHVSIFKDFSFFPLLQHIFLFPFSIVF